MFVLEADDALETVTPIKPSGPVLRRRHINKHLEHDRSNHWKLSFTIMQMRPDKAAIIPAAATRFSAFMAPYTIFYGVILRTFLI